MNQEHRPAMPHAFRPLLLGTVLGSLLLAPALALAQAYPGGGYGGAGGLGGAGQNSFSHGGQGVEPEENKRADDLARKKHEEPEPAQPIPAPKLIDAPQDADAIAAVVNGDVITRADVENQARLFALSTGLPVTADLLNRLRPQITRKMIDDRLREQEIQHRKIVVPDADVAEAVASAEKRNNLPPGGLKAKLATQDVPFSVLINEMRTSIGWNRVLRQELAERGYVTDQEITEEEKKFKAQEGQPQYRVGEIFIAAEDPGRVADARRFADLVIQQLRAGAPFGIVAAEFSQSETALKGGELGWVRPDQLNPVIAKLVTEMPKGAVSNPVPVPGGFDVITLMDQRKVGYDLATVVSIRQAFFPFSSPLDPANPTEQQRHALATAEEVTKTATACPAMEAANKAQGGKRPSDPGELRLDHMNPQMQSLLNSLKIGQPSKALVTPEGVMVLMVCSRVEKNLAAMTREDMADQLVGERVELASRQLQQDLKRRALIDTRNSQG